MGAGDFCKLGALIIFAVSLTFSASADSSNWNLDNLTQPFSHTTVSNDTHTVQLVNLTDSNDDPVDQQRLSGDDATLNYVYNKSTGPEKQMTHLSEGYYYANFTFNTTTGKKLEFELEDDSSDGFEENKTQHLQMGNITAELLTDFSGKVRKDRSFDLKINATDAWNQTFEGDTGTDVDFYVTNGTFVSKMVNLNNKDDTELFWKNFGASLPLAGNSTYIGHANVTRRDAPYRNANGSHSVLIETFAVLEGEVDYLNATSGCSNESFFTGCERDTTIDTGFNVTSASAERVNLTVMLEEEDTGDWKYHTHQELTLDNGLYTGKVDFPDVNTSKYTKNVMLEYNASNGARTFIERRNITSRSYKIRDKSSPTVEQGETYDVEIQLAKYFTLESLKSGRFENVTIDMKQPNGSIFETFNLSDMEYLDDEELFQEPVEIDSNAENGSYDTDITAFNIYWEKKTLESGFEVKESGDDSFNTSGDIELDVNKTGLHETSFNVTNQEGSETTLEANFSGDIENFTEVNNGSDIVLSGDETLEVNVTFNISRVEDYSGEITLSDTGSDNNETLDVDLNAPECGARDGVLCIPDDSWVNVTSAEKGEKLRFVELVYLGDKNGSTTVETSVTGTIADYLTVASGFELEDTSNVTLDYTVEGPGVFEGDVEFEAGTDTVSIKTKLESSTGETTTDTGIKTAGSLDLGYFPLGETRTADVTVENTGSVQVTGISASSTVYDVSIVSPSSTLEVDETRTFELEFSEVEAESGTVTLSGESSGETVESSIPVTANPVPDYSSRASELERRITQLSSSAESESTLNRLQELETQISQLKTAYNSGNYQEAQQNFNSVKDELDSIEQRLSSGEQAETGGTQQGGPPVLPIAIGLLVLLAVAFVAYTSVIPEEGDPLYNLLGEK